MVILALPSRLRQHRKGASVLRQYGRRSARLHEPSRFFCSRNLVRRRPRLSTVLAIDQAASHRTRAVRSPNTQKTFCQRTATRSSEPYSATAGTRTALTSPGSRPPPKEVANVRAQAAHRPPNHLTVDSESADCQFRWPPHRDPRCRPQPCHPRCRRA